MTPPPDTAAYYYAAYAVIVLLFVGYALSVWWRGRHLPPSR